LLRNKYLTIRVEWEFFIFTSPMQYKDEIIMDEQDKRWHQRFSNFFLVHVQKELSEMALMLILLWLEMN
jgi:hypothetical protein